MEIAPDRTPYSQTFADPNGTVTYVTSAQPRWVRRGASWVVASASLVRSGNGSWSPEAAENGLVLSGGGGRVLATERSGSRWLSVSWPSALPRPVVSGAIATYRNVFAGVDLVVAAQVSGGFSETLVIRNLAAAADPGLKNLVLGLSMSPGLRQHPGMDGSVVIETAKGTPVFTSPAPAAWDSVSSGPDLSSPAPGARVDAIGASYRSGGVRLSLPAALLSGPASSFPVYADPSYSASPTSEAYGDLQSEYPTTNEYDSTYESLVAVGYDGGSVDRGQYEFGLPSAADGPTADVLSATLTAEAVVTFTSTSQSHTIDLYETSQYTTASTWDNSPSALEGPSAQTFTTTSTAPDLNVSWNVASWLQSDLQGNGTQFTVGLQNTNETSESPFVKFSDDPTLTITYDHAPLQPVLSISPEHWASNGSLYTSSLTPALSATTTDPDGDAITYEFQIDKGSTTIESGTVSSVTSGTTATWTATTALSDDTTYTAWVQAYDGTEYSAYGISVSFTTDSDAPAAPTVSCSAYPSDTWSTLASGGTTCTFSDSSTQIQGYEYALQDGSGTLALNWTTSSTVTIDPTSDGEYHLYYTAENDAGTSTDAAATYDFGVGTSGAVLSPADGSQSSTIVTLQAAAPAGYTDATFEYRLGSSGSFTTIPSSAIGYCGCTVTWPVSASSDAMGVQTDALTWYVTRTVADDGPIEIEAVFTDSSGDTVTTPAVTVNLDRLGTGVDYGTATVGPVTVGLQSGNAALSATDVSISSYGAALDVSRTFNSVDPTANSMFGTGWTSSLTTDSSSWTSVTDDGSYVLLTGSDGSTYDFAEGSTSSSGVTSYTPEGEAAGDGLTLTESADDETFTLTDGSGDVITFTAASSGNVYSPTTVTTPGTSSSAGYVYDETSTDAAYGKPVLMVAPDAASSEPSTEACPYPVSASTWTAGCRGLTFTYNSSGDVTEVDFVYAGNSGTFHDTPVANYGYDSTGRLTSEWDPRLATSLVTSYTYDETSTDADYGRITEVTPAQASGSDALAPWTLSYDDISTSADYGKLISVSRTHSSAYGGATGTQTIDYEVPGTISTGGPLDMDASTVAEWDQTDIPDSGVAIWPASYVPSSSTSPTSTDYEHATIYYYDADGHEVNTATYSGGAWDVTTTEYDSAGNEVRTLSAADRATALASSDPESVADELDSRNVYECDDFGTLTSSCDSSDDNYMVLADSYGPAHTADVDGVDETIRTLTVDSYDSGAPDSDVSPSGDPYMLVTSETTEASVGSDVPGSSTADARTTEYEYTDGSDTAGWALGEPLETITDPGGLAITSTDVYNEDSSLYNGDALQTASYMPSDASGGTAGDTETIYYTAGTNALNSACGNEPEWANLVCETEPAAQPSDTSIIPVTTYTYNDYLEVLTKTETFGSTGTRTTTYGYDADGRQVTEVITVSGSGMGTAVPETETVYDTDTDTGLTGATETLNTSGGVTASITETYDDFGNELTYTDASGNTTTYTYDIAGRVISRDDGEGTETLSYSDSDTSPDQITDSQAGTFTASYNADGDLATETYPGGTTATYTYDPTGVATSVLYSNSGWSSSISDSVALNAQGDWATESELGDSKTYTYDADDRLTEVEDALDGSCATRAYTYDADSNRTSLTTYDAASDGSCQTSAQSSAETYTYDAADRLTSTTAGSYSYDTQGDITSTPSSDADGDGTLTATYYANNMLASQTQDGTTESWVLDPTQERFGSYIKDGVTYTDHYSDSGTTPTWVSGSDGSWTRYVMGFGQTLAAQVTSSGVTLELTDLHGDTMATATTSTAATGPAVTYVYTEFGTPETGTPGAYGWLGGDGIWDEALGGQLIMGVRAYNAGTGRFDQVDPMTGGSANAYDYANQNPITNIDPTGLYWKVIYAGTYWFTFWQETWIDKNWFTHNIANLYNFLLAFVRIDSLEYRYGELLITEKWVGRNPPGGNRYRTLYYWVTQWKVRFTIHVGWFDLWSSTLYFSFYSYWGVDDY